ncbi:MAG: DUF58 domain-containing protein [Planctomycetota bacterium]
MVARESVEGLNAGRHRSIHQGSSIEFREHRPYVPGDDLKDIDWKVYGKSDRLYVRQFEDETNLQCTIMIDRSGSMNYAGERAVNLSAVTREGKTSKQDYATALAAAIAYALLSKQDAVGLLTFDTRIRDSLPPRTRSSHLHALLSVLAAAHRGGETELADVLAAAPAKLPRRGITVLLTDGFGDVSAIGQSLAAMRSRKQDVMIMQILDRDEIDFPFNDRIEFRDLERPDQRELVDARSLKESYLESIRRHNAALVSICNQRRIDHVMLTTDEPLVDALATFLHRRRALIVGRGAFARGGR